MRRLLVFLGLLVTLCVGIEFYVSEVGTPNGNCTLSYPCASIQDVLDVVDSNNATSATINVGGGQYGGSRNTNITFPDISITVQLWEGQNGDSLAFVGDTSLPYCFGAVSQLSFVKLTVEGCFIAIQGEKGSTIILNQVQLPVESVYPAGGSLEVYNCSFVTTRVFGFAQSVIMENVVFSDSSSIHLDNSIIGENATISISNCSFEDYSEFFLKNFDVIIDNTILTMRYPLLIDTTSTVIMNNVVFDSTLALDYSINIVNVDTITLDIVSLLSSSSSIIWGMKITGATIVSISGGSFNVPKNVLYFTEVQNTFILGVSFYSGKNEPLQIENTNTMNVNFEDCTFVDYDLIMLTAANSGNQITFQNCTLEGSTGIYFNLGGSIMIDRFTMRDIQTIGIIAGLVFEVESNVTVTNSSFSNISAWYSVLNFILSTVTISNTSFDSCWNLNNDTLTDTLGGAINFNSADFSISNSTFTNCSSLQGGALYAFCSDTQDIHISSSSFISNNASIGGAILLTKNTSYVDFTPIYMDDVIFDSNYADSYAAISCCYTNNMKLNCGFFIETPSNDDDSIVLTNNSHSSWSGRHDISCKVDGDLSTLAITGIVIVSVCLFMIILVLFAVAGKIVWDKKKFKQSYEEIN